MSDEEVITLEICGENSKQHKDQDIFDYFQASYQACFPNLVDRILFARQVANLWLVKVLIQQRLTALSGQADDPVKILDTLPLLVCGYTRLGCDRCFKPLADYGLCAAKQLDYYGFKLGLRISLIAMITCYLHLPARPHDIQFLTEFHL